MLTETTLLSLLAGGAGIGLAVWLLDVLPTADLPLPIPVTFDLRLDGRVLAFTLGVSVVAGALLGLVPALQSTRPDLVGALRGESAGGAQPGQLRWRNALVIAQPTISLALLVGAGLFLRSFPAGAVGGSGVRPRADRLMTFLTPSTGSRPRRREATRSASSTASASLPGVEAVGSISNLQPAPAQHELERLQGRRLRTADGPRRLHRGPSQGRSRVLRRGGHRGPPRAQLQ